MQKIIIFSLFLAFIFSSNLSLAASYPATCPAVAQGILNAIVGGCSSIDRATYSNIYDKCCVVVAVPAKTTIPAPSSKPTTVPTTKPASETKTVVPSTSSLPTSTPSTQENLPTSQAGLVATITPEETVASTSKPEPIVSLIKFIGSIFTGFFKIFGFGK